MKTFLVSMYRKTDMFFCQTAKSKIDIPHLNSQKEKRAIIIEVQLNE